MMRLRIVVLLGGLLGLSLGPCAPVVYAHGGNTALIHACVNNSSGELRIVGANGACQQNWSAIDWNISGPTGGSGNAIQGAVEESLAVIRGAVNGPGPLPIRGEGFTVSTYTVLDSFGNVVCVPNPALTFFPGYLITFDEPFDGQPTITLGMHGRAEHPHIIQIDDVKVPGGISNSTFAVFMKDAQTNTCASQPWEFIAIGPRATP